MVTLVGQFGTMWKNLIMVLAKLCILPLETHCFKDFTSITSKIIQFVQFQGEAPKGEGVPTWGGGRAFSAGAGVNRQHYATVVGRYLSASAHCFCRFITYQDAH